MFPTLPIYLKPGETRPFDPPVRTVHTVFIHCSASDEPEHDDVSVIRRWHTEPVAQGGRGWADVGYHLFIRKDGTVQPGRPLERTPAAQQGFNQGTIAICLHGLLKPNFTAAQIEALVRLCQAINSAYADRGVKIRFRGHREVANKSCPVIDYRGILNLEGEGFMREGAPSAPPLAGDGLLADEKDLDLMDRGADVRALQAALVQHGVSVEVDGIFGMQTREAVIRFQRANGLIPNGVVGRETRTRLRMAMPVETV